MNLKTLIVVAIAASLAFETPARAQNNNGLGAAIIGGILLCGLTNCANNRRTTRRRHAVNQTVLADQKALNYFGFNAGAPDGVSGRKTRAAISGYQTYMRYPATGKLDATQRANLINAYQWAQSGRAAAYPGITGQELLRAYSTEIAGGNYCQQTGRCPYTAPQPVPQPTPFAGTGGKGNVVPANQRTASNVLTGNQEPTLPSFGNVGTSGADISIASFCQTVDLVSAANGGATSNPQAIRDKDQALNEQFCAARDYAIATTDQMLSSANYSDQQIGEKCGQVVQFMDSYSNGLSAQPAAAIVNSTRQAVAGSGIPANDVARIGKICLGFGYRKDDADMVTASSLLMVGAGAAPYSETLGHQLRAGLGAEKNPLLAKGWYDQAFSALDGGAAPAFLPTQSAQRVAVMRAALTAGPAQGGGTLAGTGSGGLPTFNLGNN